MQEKNIVAHVDGVLEKNVQQNLPIYVSQLNGFKSMALKRQSTLKNAVQVVAVMAVSLRS